MIVADCSPQLVRLRMDDGSVIWRNDSLATGQIHADPIVNEHRWIIGIDGSDPGWMISIDPVSGTELARLPMPSGIFRVLEGAGLQVVVHPDGSLSALDAATGVARWRRQREVQSFREWAPLEMSGQGLIHWLRSSKELVRLDPATGEPLATIRFDQELTAAPESDSERVAVALADGTVILVDAQTLVEEERLRLPAGAAWIHLAGDRLVGVSTRPGSIVVWKHVPGEALRSMTFDEATLSTPRPVLHDGHLYFGTEEGSLIAVEVEALKKAWELPTLSAPRSMTMTARGMFVGTREGRLYAISFDEGL